MAIRVVQGLIQVDKRIEGARTPSAVSPSVGQASLQASQNNAASAAAISNAVAHSSTLTDAAFTAFRASRTSQPGEKVRELEKAEKLARSVAGDISESGDSGGASHSKLDATQARGHFKDTH